MNVQPTHPQGSADARDLLRDEAMFSETLLHQMLVDVNNMQSKLDAGRAARSER